MTNSIVKEILHWTPFGLFTVPLFVIFGYNRKGINWLFLNGAIQGTYWFILINLIGYVFK